jgi:hypothetical protein
MATNKHKQMPKQESVDELIEFFETQDMGEYWDELPEAHFEVDLQKRTHVFALDDDLTTRLNAIAKIKRVPSERLINTWLREKIAEQPPVSV